LGLCSGLAPVRSRYVRYLDVDTARETSEIGLGTEQIRVQGPAGDTANRTRAEKRIRRPPQAS